MTSEICIVGGGPAGLAAAVALTQSGRELTVLDCALPPIDKACGEGLLPESLAALEKLGVNLAGNGMPIRGIRFIGHIASVSADFPHGVGRGLRRVELHQALLSRAEELGIRMLWGVKNVSTRRGRVSFSGGHIDTRLIVGADGQKSSVRREAGLDRCLGEKRRFGFRRHYGVAPWSAYVEVYWADRFQIYVTPVASKQVCVALISTDPHLRLDAALPRVPALFARLSGAPLVTPEKGSQTVSRQFRRVVNDGYVLLGDASGSVDAITGEGLSLAFKQSATLVDALDAGDLCIYQRAHRTINAKAQQMAGLILMLDSKPAFQRKALAALATHPRIFGSLLAAHVGNKPLTDLFSWQLISFGLGVLTA